MSRKGARMLAQLLPAEFVKERMPNPARAVATPNPMVFFPRLERPDELIPQGGGSGRFLPFVRLRRLAMRGKRRDPFQIHNLFMDLSSLPKIIFPLPRGFQRFQSRQIFRMGRDLLLIGRDSGVFIPF